MLCFGRAASRSLSLAPCIGFLLRGASSNIASRALAPAVSLIHCSCCQLPLISTCCMELLGVSGTTNISYARRPLHEDQQQRFSG